LYFKRLYSKRKIVAYEPDPGIFRILKKNLSACGFSDVDLREAAAWTEDGDLNFYSEGSLAGSTEVDFLSKGNIGVVQAERLKLVLCQRKVDFLKMDIEGAENTVLFDIELELSNVENLFFEYHSIRGI
jgi:FkbM family methyltransferase